MQNLYFIDIHTHKNLKDPQVLAIFNLLAHQTIEIAFLDTSSLFSIGLHPWYLDAKASIQLVELQKLANHQQIFAIGEAGLDRAIQVDWDWQTTIFKKQIEIAEKVAKPLIIHCVRAYPDLIFMKKNNKTNQPWIVHGFSGNAHIAKDLLQHNFYLSFGALLLHSIKLQKTFTQIPLESIFLETDNSDITIQDMYRKAAFLKNISIEALQSQIIANFEALNLYQSDRDI